MVKVSSVNTAGAAIRKTRGSCREQLFLDVPLERDVAPCFLGGSPSMAFELRCRFRRARQVPVSVRGQHQSQVKRNRRQAQRIWATVVLMIAGAFKGSGFQQRWEWHSGGPAAEPLRVTAQLRVSAFDAFNIRASELFFIRGREVRVSQTGQIAQGRFHFPFVGSPAFICW